MVQQVLMRLDGGTPTFETHDNQAGRSPLSFEDVEHGLRIPRLGSQDILRIAEYASGAGYHIDSFQLSDHTLTHVAEPLAGKVSKKLVKRLNAGVSAADVEDLLREEWPGLIITGVMLTTPEHSTASLQRQGVFWSPAGWSPTRFLSDAWQVIRFW
ncbi:hypothetical protein [Microbacterium phyllosphaerae]|uniref:hypothetical protein n=1 Tax=Microbacterium phyllosphaerae TaxID=124798 RepID=UPI0021682BED|nr:hypothetical protein [Microbacterium phyllosphaerae]MCS3442200.1 hypothetical protein [Microbacterium phyllosphaerae]